MQTQTIDTMAKTKPLAEIRDVTPDWAAQVLSKHDKAIEDGTWRQRPRNQYKVAAYAADMRAGNWALNGQGISFDEDENLLDGQKRLAAVVWAKRPVRMLVMWNLPSKINSSVRTMDTVDVGQPRNLSQQMKIDGMENYGVLATGVRYLAQLCRKGDKRVPMSMAQGIQIATVFRGQILKAAELLGAGGQRKNLRGYIIAPVVLLRCVSADEADLFATDFNEMANLGKTSPVLALRRHLDRPTTLMGRDREWRNTMAVCSAMRSYIGEKRVEVIRGNQEDVDWLLTVAKSQVQRIRESLGTE